MSKECYYMRNKKRISNYKYNFYFNLMTSKCSKRLKKKAKDRIECEDDLTYYESLEEK